MRRPPLQLIFFGPLAIGLALAAGVNAAANVWRGSDPDLALRLRSDDAVALSVRADRELAASGGTSLTGAIPNARLALRSEPLTAPALRSLAAAQMADPAAGPASSEAIRGLLTLAHRVSRRDLGTQFLLIEDASSRDDLGETLQYYDEALSTNDAAGDVLFGVLAAGLSDPDIRQGVARYATRPWFGGFLMGAVDQADDLDALAELALATRRQIAGEDDLTPRLLAALVAKGRWTTARNYMHALVGAGAPVLNTIGFDAETTDVRFAPLSWTLNNGSDATAELSSKGGLDISIEPSRSVQLAQRFTLLRPGEYSLRNSINIDDAGHAAELSWEVLCLGAIGEVFVLRQFMPAQAGNVPYQSHLHLPEGCDAQRWRLYGGSKDVQAPSRAGLSDIRLTREPAGSLPPTVP